MDINIILKQNIKNKDKINGGLDWITETAKKKNPTLKF